MDVETAVRPYSQWSGGSGVAHSDHRLAQGIGSAPSRVGASLAQPCHQYVAGAGGDGQQRVIAPLVRLWRIVVALGAFLGQPIGLTDGGVQVDDQRLVARSGPSRSGPIQQLMAHPVQLAHVAPLETPQERTQCGRGLDRVAQHMLGTASA